MNVSSFFDVGSHSPPPLGASILDATHSLLQSMWEPPIHLPLEPIVLASTPPRDHPPSRFILLSNRCEISHSTPFKTPRPLLQSMWDPLIHPTSRSSVLTSTSPHGHPPSRLSLLTGTTPSVKL